MACKATTKRPPQNERANRAIRFINALTHTKDPWAGKPFRLRKWQESFIRRLFGTLNPDGTRQYRTAFKFVGRKNGKSEECAAMALYGLLSEGEQGAEIYSAAADRDQASLVFNVAAQMVRNDRTLSGACKIIDSQKRIVNFKTGSFYRAISSEAYTKHGFNASMVIADEVHAWPSDELWDVLKTSMGTRTQPLMIGITTAGWDKQSLAGRLYEYACKVRDGLVDDPTFLPEIWECLPEDDWNDEANWHKANPALGDFRRIEEMRELYRMAREMPEKENTFRRLYLNQWTASETKWLPMPLWRECADAEVELYGKRTPAEREASLAGRECYGGLDLAKTQDVAALVLSFPEPDGGVTLLPYFWVPEETAEERERKARVPYATWGRQGLMKLTVGSQIDYDYIRDRINKLARMFNLVDVRFDPWNASYITQGLMKDGIKMIEFRQSVMNFNEPSREFESLIRSRKLYHGNHPVLNWMADNVMTTTDHAGNIKPAKPDHGVPMKIDGVVAAIMSVAGATIGREWESLYESQGLTVL